MAAKYNMSFGDLAMDYLIGGIDQNLAGNGGPDCLYFRSDSRKIMESLIILLISFLSVRHGAQEVWSEISVPVATSSVVSGSRQAVTAFMTTIFGIQIGYKLVSRTLIWLLQPCHGITVLQIVLLAAPHNRYTNSVYRIHLGVLQGPLLACLFPVFDTYFLPFEFELYWIQHIAILLVPFYLNTQHQFTDKPIMRSHALLSYAVFLVYHIVFLQPISISLGVNISTTLCPAATDPFYGPNYLLHAIWHQAVVIFLVAQVYSFLLCTLPSTLQTHMLKQE